VANHASYLDGIILTAALPAGFTYLIKQQMARVPIAGFVLRRLGSAFVDRNDPNDRQRIARALVGLAVKGDALGFFPEGTFDASPGLKPFQLGAFSAAARANLPVVPIVIYGSRHNAIGQRAARTRAAARSHLRSRARHGATLGARSDAGDATHDAAASRRARSRAGRVTAQRRVAAARRGWSRHTHKRARYMPE
jgi:1-acyl-sn-glycerol-3-phosphate acyltransferase